MATSRVIVESPLGGIALCAEDGALVSVWIGDEGPGPPLGPGVDPEGLGRRPGLDPLFDGGSDPDPLLREAREQLTAWFRGTLRAFDLPLRPRGTPFQQAVWRELVRIPFGETRTYGDIAAALGRPTACRAVGAANGRNPIAIVVPCHRVIGASGALTGYAGGLARKRWLLDHERAVLAR